LRNQSVKEEIMANEKNYKRYFTTRISNVLPNKILIRGYPQQEIIGNLSFAEGFFLTIKGRLPKQNEKAMLEALLNALLDHGFIAASISGARYIASGNPQFIPAVAGGLLAAGANTISPQHSAEFINEAYNLMTGEKLTIEETAKKVVDKCLKEKRRIPGFGHPVHKDFDIRAVRLRELAEKYGLLGEKTKLYEAIHKEFLNQTRKKGIPINVDGMMAAIMNELGFDPLEMVAVAALAVLPGIMAHAIEEIKEGVPIRVIPDMISEYVGESERHIYSDKENRDVKCRNI
jgi:citrate synthase